MAKSRSDHRTFSRMYANSIICQGNLKLLWDFSQDENSLLPSKNLHARKRINTRHKILNWHCIYDIDVAKSGKDGATRVYRSNKSHHERLWSFSLSPLSIRDDRKKYFLIYNFTVNEQQRHTLDGDEDNEEKRVKWIWKMKIYWSPAGVDNRFLHVAV